MNPNLPNPDILLRESPPHSWNSTRISDYTQQQCAWAEKLEHHPDSGSERENKSTPTRTTQKQRVQVIQIYLQRNLTTQRIVGIYPEGVSPTKLSDTFRW